MIDEPSKPSLSQRAVAGVAWGILGGAVGKLAGLISQIYLGWVLSKEDFALFAIAMACAAIVAGLVNGGTQRVLVQRGQCYDEVAYVVLQISFFFNLVVMAVLMALAIPVARWYNSPTLAPMMAIMGLATLVSTPGHVLHAKLINGLQFGLVQGLAICSHCIRYGTTILFAFFGLGPLSFVLPLLVISLTDSLFAWLAVRRLPPRRPLNRQVTLDVLKDSRWVMAGAFAGGLIQNGDNLAIGIVTDKTMLGVYFFAFQLTFALSSLIGGTLQSVIMPMLVSISDDQVRQWQGVKRAVCATSLVSCGMAMTLVTIAPPLVHVLWSGKWDEAIPVVQILSLAVPALLISWIGRATIEARGGWATATCLSILEGAGTVIVAAGSAVVGGLLMIAMAVAIFKIAASLAYIAVGARNLGKKMRLALLPVVSAYAAALGGLVIGRFAVPGTYSLSSTEVADATVNVIVFSAAFLVLSLMLCQSGIAEIRTIAWNIWRQVRHSPDCNS